MSTTTLSSHTAVAVRSGPTSRGAWIGFGVVAVSAVMDLLDSTIAQTAAPNIRRELGASYADLEWISAAYTLAMAALMILGSRLGDI
jgi:MFS family permease